MVLRPPPALDFPERKFHMTMLTQASRQWARRPADQRFTSLLDLQAFKRRQADHSQTAVASTRDIELAEPSHRGLLLSSPTGAAAPTHWSFGQLCSPWDRRATRRRLISGRAAFLPGSCRLPQLQSEVHPASPGRKRAAFAHPGQGQSTGPQPDAALVRGLRHPRCRNATTRSITSPSTAISYRLKPPPRLRPNRTERSPIFS